LNCLKIPTFPSKDSLYKCRICFAGGAILFAAIESENEADIKAGKMAPGCSEQVDEDISSFLFKKDPELLY
jgi:hypothetical protein